MFKNLKIGLITSCLLITAAAFISLAYGNTRTDAASTLNGVNEVVNVATTDNLPPNKDIKLLKVSGDGNVILLWSTATNLPNAGGTNYYSFGGIYAYNIITNSTTRINVSGNGTTPDGPTSWTTVSLSENGRFVYFASNATNLIDGSTQYPGQTYIRDLVAGTIVAVSNHYWSPNSINDTADHPAAISNDGRFILVTTRYLGLSDSSFFNLMLGDRQSGTWTWTSLAQSTNVSSDSGLKQAAMNCDGSFVSYIKSGYVMQADLRRGGVITSQIGGASSQFPTMSCDGTYTLYQTINKTDVDPGATGTNSKSQIIRYNRLTGSHSYASGTPPGQYGIVLSDKASVANTGDVVLLLKDSFYLRHFSDRSGTYELATKDANGTYLNTPTNAIITSDGRYIFITDDPYNLGMASSPATIQVIRSRTGL